VHLLTHYRAVPEIASNPFWRTRAEDPGATRKNVLRHNIQGMPGVTIMPELYDAPRNVRDYSVIVVQDWVETTDGPALHEAGLLCIKTAFGFVLDTDAIMKLGAFAPASKAAA
jgi:hypothetical protein